jgi:hypothetical protein
MRNATSATVGQAPCLRGELQEPGANLQNLAWDVPQNPQGSVSGEKIARPLPGKYTCGRALPGGPSVQVGTGAPGSRARTARLSAACGEGTTFAAVYDREASSLRGTNSADEFTSQTLYAGPSARICEYIMKRGSWKMMPRWHYIYGEVAHGARAPGMEPAPHGAAAATG